jgi:hypothetical protein
MTATADATDDDLENDLTFINLTDPRAAVGLWLAGRVAGHAFEARVWLGHAADPAVEIKSSRLTKLWVLRLADGAVVFEWDRGPIRPAADAEASRVVDFLAAGLAEHVFGG